MLSIFIRRNWFLSNFIMIFKENENILKDLFKQTRVWGSHVNTKISIITDKYE